MASLYQSKVEPLTRKLDKEMADLLLFTQVKSSNTHMAKKGRKTRAKWDNDNTTTLARAFLSMRDSGEMKAFMRDLLTEAEIIEFGKRFYAARAIAGSTHYAAIEEATGLSSRTIARVKKWYKHGTGGYRLAIKRWRSQV